MSIVNHGTMGIVFNFAPNYGVQAGLSGVGGGVGSTTTGLVFNYANNYGLQAGNIIGRY